NATFIYSLITLGWVDRENSGIVPVFSMLIVVILAIACMFAFAWLVGGVGDLLVTNTLRAVGDRGRIVLQETFNHLEAEPDPVQRAVERDAQSRPVTQSLSYRGVPGSIPRFDQKSLVELARQFDALIEIDCAVGDTIVYDTRLLQVRGASGQISEDRLWNAI